VSTEPAVEVEQILTTLPGVQGADLLDMGRLM
jgi:hypothetical protein